MNLINLQYVFGTNTILIGYYGNIFGNGKYEIQIGTVSVLKVY